MYIVVCIVCAKQMSLKIQASRGLSENMVRRGIVSTQNKMNNDNAQAVLISSRF